MLHRVSFVLVIGLAAMLCGSGGPLAEATDHSLEVSVSQGYDSNPLELNPDALMAPFEAPRGSYTRLDLDARLAHSWNPRVGYFVSARGQGRMFPSGLEQADSSAGRVEAGLGLVLFARGERKLSAALSGSYGLDRSTFIDPATGMMYVTLADPNTLAPIPDRFDVNVAVVNVNLRLRASGDLLFLLDSSLERQNYIEDYEEIPTLESLDDRAITLRPGLRWQMSQRVRLDVTGEWNDRRYDALSALEEDASPAAGTRRRYRSEGLRTVLRIQPSGSWTLQLGLGGADRQDLHAGYYDSVLVNSFASAAWAVTPTTRLGLHISHATFDYERATLGFVPNGDLRGGDLIRAAASAERDLGGHVTLFGEAGEARSDDADPLYTYHRSWAQAGLRCRL